MVLIVSEIGLNHDGRWDRAYEMIRQAALAGADIAKFQLGWRDKPGEINYVPLELAIRLKEWCGYWGIEFMASIINEQALELARQVEPDRYKIASRTVVDKPELVDSILAEDKETFVSLGWWKREGRTEWPCGAPSPKIRYIYCESSYPTFPQQVRGLPERFSEDGFYGFSDHTLGLEASFIAIARGARFIERHFTLDKTIVSVHNDHILASTPEEMRTLCELGKPMSRLVGVLEGEREGVAGVPEAALKAASGA